MSKSFQGLLILIGIVIFIAYTIISAIFKTIADNIIVIILVALFGLFVFIAYIVYSKMYFKSKKFKGIKESISEHTNNCNELNQYIEELKGSYVNIESYNYGTGKMIDNS